MTKTERGKGERTETAKERGMGDNNTLKAINRLAEHKYIDLTTQKRQQTGLQFIAFKRPSPLS